MFNALKGYFSEFAVLKTASKDFWLANVIQFFDGLAYFSMIIIISMYLTDNVGFSDMEQGLWQGIFFLFISAFMFAVGSICDVLGIKNSLFLGIGINTLARLGLAVAPILFPGELMKVAAVVCLILMALGTSTSTPVVSAAIRRFTTRKIRGTGFNMYYLIMNIGAAIAGFAVVDGFRNSFGPVNGNLAILAFGFLCGAITFAVAFFVNDQNYAEPDEKVADTGELKRPLKLFAEVWKEKPFQLLTLFLVLTLGVRLVFTHQSMVMPKYYVRTMFSDFDLGFYNSLNPIIIVVGLIVIIPIINKFDVLKLIIVGMLVSALSLIFMAVPLEWTLAIPGINNINQAYVFIFVTQILVFAVGELIFSPRFTEYTASVAPSDRVATYMALSALPMFIARPINGFISGILISNYSYDGIRAKIDTGNISYIQSPEFMWMIYFGLAILSPILVIMLKNTLSGGRNKDAAPAEH